MLERLMERGKTSGRDDDNVESIKKRFRTSAGLLDLNWILTCDTGTYKAETMPVIEYYDKQKKVAEVGM